MNEFTTHFQNLTLLGLFKKTNVVMLYLEVVAASKFYPHKINVLKQLMYEIRFTSGLTSKKRKGPFAPQIKGGIKE